MRNRNLTQRRLKEVLRYNQSTGIFIWRAHRQNPNLVGAVAGSTDAYGYRIIYVDGVPYKAHRLAFLYTEGRWPVGRLDHKNLIKNDNRRRNLREATSAQNNSHVPRRANSSGFKGVDFYKATGKWRARISRNGKTFLLGYHTTPEAAARAYDKAARVAHGTFAVLNIP